MNHPYAIDFRPGLPLCCVINTYPNNCALRDKTTVYQFYKSSPEMIHLPASLAEKAVKARMVRGANTSRYNHARHRVSPPDQHCPREQQRKRNEGRLSESRREIKQNPIDTNSQRDRIVLNKFCEPHGPVLLLVSFKEKIEDSGLFVIPKVRNYRLGT